MLNIRVLPSDLAQIAVNELNEVPERIAADLTAIKEWLMKTPYMTARTDDQFLVAFLRGCKYSIEKVKEKLDVYYTVRKLIPELMKHRDPLDTVTANLLKLGSAVPLPKLSASDAPVVLIIQASVHDPELVSVSQWLTLALINTDIQMMENDNLSVVGQVLIFDMANLTMGHILATTPIELQKIIVLNQEAVPIRQKVIHFINVPPSFLALYNLAKTLLSDKLRRRMIMHKDLDALHKHIPKSILPKEYGGDLGPFSVIIEDWAKNVRSKRDYLLDDLKYGIDESKRPTKSKLSDYLGVGAEGTFRKLAVD